MSLLHAVGTGARHAGRRSLGGMGGGAGTVSPAALSMVKLLVVSLCHLPLSYAAPIFARGVVQATGEDEPKSPSDPDLYVYLGIATALVLLGGAFAGLTIALMGQDEIYLQVIASSGEGSERKNANKVLKLLKKGKHWVLVTLLLSNVITNETLPIVLDRSLGGGWPAVLSSTVLIVIFGEVAPQSICVRYGLPIGAFMAPVVLALMWIMAPVAWPTAKLLDWLLGEDHGTTYKKAGLKTLVTLHKTLGTVPGERLNEDEVTIISAVLDLKDKPVGAIMTPMQDVFTMSADTILDEKMMDTILSQGYSRIPIYHPENPRNYIGMLLVKILITYDPEDALRVRDFALATLPETAPNTSCLDIVNFFQEGKSHMVLVSDFPGQDKGALGVVTLEDVIEELIGEEIIDESDVFVDVHKAIRRMAPAPRTRYVKGQAANDIQHDEETDDDDHDEADEETGLLSKKESRVPTSRKGSVNGSTTVLMRRASNSSAQDPVKPTPVRSNTADLRQHLKHLGPSNVASRPKATKYTSVKIKPGVSTIPENQAVKPASIVEGSQRPASVYSSHVTTTSALEGGVGAGLLDSAGNDAKDGVLALTQGYGTMTVPSRSSTDNAPNDDENVATGVSSSPAKSMSARQASAFADQHTSTEPAKGDAAPTNGQNPEAGKQGDDHDAQKNQDARDGHDAQNTRNAQDIQNTHDSQDAQDVKDKKKDKGKDEKNDDDKNGDNKNDKPRHELPEKIIVEGGFSRPISRDGGRSHSFSSHSSTLGEMEHHHKRSHTGRTARSGSITETVMDVNGMKKVVLEANSSSDEGKKAAQTDGTNDQWLGDDHDGANKGGSKKKKKKKRAGKKFHKKDDSKNNSGDSTPQLH